MQSVTVTHRKALHSNYLQEYIYYSHEKTKATENFEIFTRSPRL